MIAGLDVRQVGVARRGGQAADDRLQPLGRDVLDVGDPLADRLHAALVDVDADHLVAGLEELDRERQPDVAEPDDPDSSWLRSVRIEHVANALSGVAAAVQVGALSASGWGAPERASAASASRSTSTFQPASTVSTHSVVSRSVTHGVSSR